MAGNKNSGRRAEKLDPKVAEGLGVPGDTYESVHAFLDRVVKAAAEGNLPPREAEVLGGLGRTALAVVKANAGASVEARIKKLRLEFEEIRRAGLAHAAAARLHQADDNDQ